MRWARRAGMGLVNSTWDEKYRMLWGYQGAGWLERPNREAEERTDLLVENLPLEADDAVADIGAGTGYFTFRIAPRVPDGKVFAVDIQQEMLDIIEERKENSGMQKRRTLARNRGKYQSAGEFGGPGSFCRCISRMFASV